MFTANGVGETLEGRRSVSKMQLVIGMSSTYKKADYFKNMQEDENNID